MTATMDAVAERRRLSDALDAARERTAFFAAELSTCDKNDPRRPQIIAASNAAVSDTRAAKRALADFDDRRAREFSAVDAAIGAKETVAALVRYVDGVTTLLHRWERNPPQAVSDCVRELAEALGS